MKILVTGASGFVGHHAIAALTDTYPGAKITALGSAPGMTRLDLTDRAALRALISDIRPDGCLHLAAVSAIGAARADPDAAWRVNLHATLDLARALLTHAPACRLVFASSSEVYGASFRAGLSLDETATPAPQNLYAATKAAADLALGAMASEGLRVVRMRPFNHTGPGQQDSFVVAAFARQVARIAAGRQAPVMVVGALDPLRDFLDVRDVARAYAACLQPQRELAPGLILNLASGRPVRIGDILDALLTLAGVAARIDTGQALLRPTEIRCAAGDATAAAAALGWTPRIPWAQTLEDVWQDWRRRVACETAS
jgi:nucleoside-diphosphate-sugar epimerase